MQLKQDMKLANEQAKFKKKCKRISTKLEQWLLFIINENMEEINMVDNKYVKKAEFVYFLPKKP